MKSVRERFEEIWPVPEGVYWSPVFGAYICADGSPRRLQCMELNLRLETFARCQETIAAVDQRGAEMRGLLAETSKAILRHQAEQPMSRRLAGLLTKARAKVDRYLKAAAAQHTESGVGE